MSAEGTYDTDLTDRTLMEHLLTRQAGEVAGRLRKHGLSGRTISIKVRMHDFTTLSRSSTLASPTDSAATVARTARSLLADLDTSGGVRLLGVGVSGLADWIQEDLFGESEQDDEPAADPDRAHAGGDDGGRRSQHPTLPAGPGRRARRDGPRLGVGLGARRGHGALRDRGHAGRARCAPTPSTTPRCDRGCPRPTRTRSPTRRREPHGLARSQLGAAPQVLGPHHRHDRVAPGRRVVGEEHHRPAVGRHLHRPEHHALAGQLVVAGPHAAAGRPGAGRPGRTPGARPTASRTVPRAPPAGSGRTSHREGRGRPAAVPGPAAGGRRPGAGARTALPAAARRRRRPAAGRRRPGCRWTASRAPARRRRPPAAAT